MHSDTDAEALARLPITAIAHLGNDYFVIGGETSERDFHADKLDYAILAADVDRDCLYLDRRTERPVAAGITLLYERDGFRLVRTVAPLERETAMIADLLPLRHVLPQIRYSEPIEPSITLRRANVIGQIDLDSLINVVQQDSIESYLNRLQAFHGRVAGTDSNRAARDWLLEKFQSFGYDSVYVDEFPSGAGGVTWPYYNVIAVKPGTTYPDEHIIVGAHFDGVPGSPAVDDNGSGTAGVLEIARVMTGIETGISIIFIAFDGEEVGLEGSWHYADSAAARGEQILFMLNMDMIGDIANDTQAQVAAGTDSTYAEQWITLAADLVGLEGLLGGYFATDYLPFIEHGFNAISLMERIKSSVYHQYNDSTTHINFDYLTRMIKASLALVASGATDEDFDGDGITNAADNCPFAINADQQNDDSDSLGNACDNCPITDNPFQEDMDDDNLGDACDICPGDTINDLDNDVICGLVDNCPWAYNPEQTDADADGVGDVCDNCLMDFNPAQEDLDGDGTGDSCEVIRTWYVTAEGSGDAPTIQEAIDSTMHGDTVLVAAGMYAGAGMGRIDLRGRGILLRAEGGPALTILDAQGSPGTPQRCITLNATSWGQCIIEGFTFTGGCGPTYNGASSAGGLLCANADLTVTNCVFHGNLATAGAGAYVYRGNLHLVNCTFIDNTGDVGVAVFVYDNATATLDNCIIAFNRPGEPVRCEENSTAMAAETDMYGNSTGEWGWCLAGQDGNDYNFSADPHFCGAGTGDFALHDDSPCAPAHSPSGKLIGALDVGCAGTAIVDDTRPASPGQFTLHQNYPNPFNSSTVIAFSLSEPTHITLAICDILGRRIRILETGYRPAENRTVLFDGKDKNDRALPAGIYFAVLESGNCTAVCKMILLK